MGEEEIPWSSAAGYSQSISMPSNPYCCIRAIDDEINALLVLGKRAMSEKTFQPASQPPTEMNVLRPGLRSLRVFEIDVELLVPTVHSCDFEVDGSISANE